MPSLPDLSLPVLNLVDGVFRGSSSNLFFSHHSPREGTPAVDVPKSDLMDVVNVIQAMNKAQAVWAKQTREERDLQIRNFLSSLALDIESGRSILAQTLALDIGMPVERANTRSVSASIETLSRTLEVFEAASRPGQARYPSAGNSALFMGWTDPLLSFCRRVPVILAAGNGICVKPSRNAPRTVSVLASLALRAMKQAGMPLGLLAVLNGYGEGDTDDAVGDAILKHPGFKTVFWIGRSDSAEVARSTAHAHGKRFHFVGSGRNPAILFQGFEPAMEAVHVENWAQAIIDPHSFGPYRPSRLFVQDSIYKSVIERLESRFKSFRLGDPLDSTTDIGPLPKKETSNFERQLRLALSETGRLVTGGGSKAGIPEATLVRDLTNCSTLQSEELAGPWATIASFKYAHDALKYANTSPLGLAGYVLHPDLAKAKGVSEKLEASRVFFSSRPPWPSVVTSDAEAVKQSANAADGISAVFKFSRWSSTTFSDNAI